MTVVLVHGNPETDAVWDPLVDAMGRDDVVRLSPPGFGAPMPDGWPATYLDYRDWLEGELIRLPAPIDLVSADPGRVVFNCRPDESAYNPIGAVHGGLVCTLLDAALGCALHSTLPRGKGYTSVEIKVNYLKAVRLSSGLLTATGTVVKSGTRVGFTQGVVTDASGTTVATASSTLLVFDL